MPRGAARSRMVRSALRLVSVSVAFGILSGRVSVATGLHDHSLGVFAVGLDVLADVTGSAVLIWRFRDEQRRLGSDGRSETRAAVVVAIALAAVAVAFAVQSAAALASGSRPSTSGVALAAAGVSLVVLTPLAYAKRRLGGRMASRALQGDGALSGIGAASSLLALTALVLYDTLGWWQADRVAALIVAAIAAAEAWHTAQATEQALETRLTLGGARPDERSGLPLNELGPRFAPHGT
jgi:divalent metal cation (Fe/Co/Zn/Cd) transporter